MFLLFPYFWRPPPHIKIKNYFFFKNLNFYTPPPLFPLFSNNNIPMGGGGVFFLKIKKKIFFL